MREVRTDKGSDGYGDQTYLGPVRGLDLVAGFRRRPFYNFKKIALLKGFSLSLTN